MKKLLCATTLLTALFIIGCAKANQSNGTVGATATTNSACPQGYWYSNGQCYNGSTSTGANYNFNTGFYADNHTGTSVFVIDNAPKMKEFFKLGMGVCDRTQNSYGQASCEYYVTGQIDIIVQFPTNNSSAANNALVTVIARPRVNPYFNYQAQFPSTGWGLLGAAIGWATGWQLPDPTYYNGAYRNPLQMQMAVSPTNNNQGFEARGYGDYWTGLNQTLVTVQVTNGNTNSQSLNFNLLIGGQIAGHGTMNRCQSFNCGL